MVSAEFHAQRRAELQRLISDPILLMGMGERARNLPMNKVPFRQDSSFLYFSGCKEPNASLLMYQGESLLFLEEHHPSDVLWHGSVPSLEERRLHYGVDKVYPNTELEQFCSSLPLCQTIAIADFKQNQRGAHLTQQELSFGKEIGNNELVMAIIKLRRLLKPQEITIIEQTLEVTRKAHRAAMKATVVGGHERLVAAAFHYELAKAGLSSAYHSIVTVRGDILHNDSYINPLEEGQLLILDGGAEAESGYATDITRTWPVSNTWTHQQRAAYNAVLKAQEAAISKVHSGTRYREVHHAACLTLAEFLYSEGILRVKPDIAVEHGSHALFFPHGIGHLIGLDVHDLENFGDLPAYPSSRARSIQFGTAYLRLDLDLEPNMLVTIEPGFYIVPSILNNAELREHFKDDINWAKLEQWKGFGGIRIEDNVLCTDGAPRVLSHAIPKEIDDINRVRLGAQ